VARPQGKSRFSRVKAIDRKKLNGYKRKVFITAFASLATGDVARNDLGWFFCVNLRDVPGSSALIRDRKDSD